MRPKPLLAHWVPGLAFVVISLLTLTSSVQEALLALVKTYGGFGFGIIALAILSYVIGQVFDALRDIFEWVFYVIFSYLGWRDVDWYFFVKGEQRYIAGVEDWFFTYYMLNFNLAFAMISLNLVPWIVLSKGERWTSIVLVILFVADAAILRYDLVELTNDLRHETN